MVLRAARVMATFRSLFIIAVSFRVTQVVDIVRGVHAMIPKSLSAPDLRKQIAVV